MAQKSRTRSRSRKNAGRGITNGFRNELLKLINEKDDGCLNLGMVWNFFPSIEIDRIWEIVTSNENCFVVDHPYKEFNQLSVKDEKLFVRAPMGLCSVHIRKRKDLGCDGSCGALHLCRNFLLLSDNACPFNSRKKTCMFGHSFETQHNRSVLDQYGMDSWSVLELRRLFRRRHSRCPTTFPQLCIYYNKTIGQSCSNEKCKALHICKAFIDDECSGRCGKNHRFDSNQARYVLEQFAIDFESVWTVASFKKDLWELGRKRHRHTSEASASSDGTQDTYTSEEEEDVEDASPGASPSSNPSFRQRQARERDSMNGQCSGCQALYHEVQRNKAHISVLSQQMKEMTGMLKELRMKNHYH